MKAEDEVTNDPVFWDPNNLPIISKIVQVITFSTISLVKLRKVYKLLGQPHEYNSKQITNNITIVLLAKFYLNYSGFNYKKLEICKRIATKLFNKEKNLI